MTEKTKVFKNEKTIPISCAGMEGTLTIPLYLEDEHLETYYDKVAVVDAARGADNIEVGTPEFFQALKKGIGWQLQVVSHIPIDIDFPGVDIKEINEATTKFRALGLVIYKECRRLVDEATVVPL